MALIVYSTTDAGATWNEIPEPYISDLAIDQVLLGNFSTYAAATQLDLAVDQNNTLHIGVPVIQFKPGNAIDSIYQYGSWGLFDFNTSDNGNTWNACLIVRPETAFGYYGYVMGNANQYLKEESRLQLSRTWAGDKIFYTWFDTDTMIYGYVGNVFPDMHSIGYSLSTGQWTSETNFTEFSGTNADGGSAFGNVSYYSYADGANDIIPMVADDPVNIDSTGEPMDLFYIGCTGLSDYSHPGNCFQLMNQILNKESNHFLISQNYPNPFHGETRIKVSLNKVSDITIEIHDLFGQLLSSRSYKDLHPGENIITIDASPICSGLYFYKVKAGIESIAKMMSVE
jgi:hypothetical protein